VATPSEAAGVGAALCMIMAILIYRLWRPEQIWQILRDTMRESVMILTIIAAAVLFGYMLTSLYLTQTLAQGIADLHANKWVLMGLIAVASGSTRADHGLTCQGGLLAAELRALRQVGAKASDRARRLSCPG
jgi:H+/gluconate symporter-like permease